MTPYEASKPDEFECDICGETFDSVSDLEEHKRDEHELPSHIRETENWDTQRDIGEAGLPGAPQV
ncbi:MAG: C2H2-type zinc finger protein [Candidatus Kapaibacterium sp.]